MILKYKFEGVYLGRDDEHEEEFFDTDDFDYEVDITFEDIQEFFEEQNNKLDANTLKYLYENDYFEDIDEDNRFIEFMNSKYYGDAYQKYIEYL